MATDHGINGAPPGDSTGDEAPLLRVGEQLRAARPALSSAALSRVHAAMCRELDLRNESRPTVSQRPGPGQGRWSRVAVLAAVAAAVVIGLLVTWYAVTLTPRGPSAEVAQTVAAEAAAKESALAKKRAEFIAQYQAANTEALKASIAAQFAKISTDAQIPYFMQYSAAMGLVQPHLQWHAAHYSYLDPYDRILSEKVLKRASRDLSRHFEIESHSGEPWMRDAIPASVHTDLKTNKSKRIADAQEKLQSVNDPNFFWTVDDPNAPDIQRAVALLDYLKTDSAARWVDALRCNNTTLTMDVRGGYASNSAAPILLDARAAEEVTFKLYRVTDAATLKAAAQRIGSDYIFADHDTDQLKQAMEMLEYAHALQALEARERTAPPPIPEFSNAACVGTWSCAVNDMKTFSMSKHDFEEHPWRDDENDQPDSDHFGDDCTQFFDRLHREYWPDEGELSAWTCARKFEIPASALQQPGAYVLVAEANGTKACAPILVDPLSLTLRRCRDGVLVAASDNAGTAPVAGAQVVADGLLQPSATDENGVAFARVFAAGDKPILIAKDGRFAIGGFGKVFDGIYDRPFEARNYEIYDRRWNRIRDQAASTDAVGQVFEDRHVIAAYTDRPTYRPGQDVQFKLIVRLLGQKPDGSAVLTSGFRDGDFETSKLLQLPLPGTNVNFEALDKKGRPIASGSAGLNEFGTASGTIHLSSECATGVCALRVNLNGTARIVPDVFAVQNYRRPNFEVTLPSAPANLTKLAGQKVHVAIQAKYYFGKSVARAKAQVRLVHAENWRPLAETSLVLSDDGAGMAELELPATLPGGEYHLICAVTDDSNQTVSQTASATVDLPPAPKAETLSGLPRFVAAGDVLRVRGVTGNVEMIHDGIVKQAAASADGIAELKLTPGWWRLRNGGSTSVVFAYGEGAAPFDYQDSEEKGFVNLANYTNEESGDRFDYTGRKPELWALFGRQHAAVGEKISVLLYTPGVTRVLLTMEGRTVLDYVTAPLDGKSSYAVVEIPIRERHVPNFYLQGCAIGKSGGMAQQELRKLMDKLQERADSDGEDPKWCRIDVVDTAKHAGEKLNVDVVCDAPEHRPGDEVGVTIRVTGTDGKPREAEVSLGAVDASLYAFGADRSGSLAQTFADARPPRRFLPKAWKISEGILFSPKYRIEQMSQLAQAQDAAKAAIQLDDKAIQQTFNREGDLEQITSKAGHPHVADHASLTSLGEMPVTEIPLTGWRTDFRETAAWLPQLRTDAQGRLSARFKLPDSLTRYRINAVGLTRQTEIGSGRSELLATLPLSVQVFLPRFAVEGDTLLLTGLIHNTTAVEINAPFAFEIRNATCTGPAADTTAQISSANGTTTVQGRIRVAAHSTAHVGAWLKIDRLGSLTVGLKAGDANASDAEQREIPVIPDGRPLDISVSGAANGEIQLPLGFVPSDVRLSVSRSMPSEALQGLGYLVDYPYGCVEQTMSRFLPTVMAKHAWTQGVAEMPADVLKKLPDVLNAGLARLYNFQHADGGWGWWEHDQTNDGMSVYVVYGLARCKSTGTPIDPGVIASGCAFVKTRLQSGALDRVLWARGWQALALAGTVTTDELKTALKTADSKLPPEALVSLALACKSLNLNDEAAALREKLTAWAPQTAEALAMKLNLEVAFGELPAARVTGDALMAQRIGLRWNSTRETSWAVEAMTALVAHLPPLGPARAFALNLAGNPVVEATTQAQLTQRVFDVHLTGAQIPFADRVVFGLNADFPEPLHYALNASGYQHLDKMEPTGSSVKMTRQYLTTDGKALPKSSAVGDCIAVHVAVKLAQRETCVLVEDRRPAGWEFAADVLHGADGSHAANVEFRDDRICVFFGDLDAGDHELVYYLRAETPGESHVIPGCAYPMYSERNRGETGGDVLLIKN